MSRVTLAFVYIRFSTVEQEGGDSFERQRDGGLELIARKGWAFTETVEDLGRSAWKGKHLDGGGLGRFSDRVRSGDIPQGSWLIAERTDRLSRQGWEPLFDWLRDMTRKGLNVVTLDGHEFTAVTMKDQLSIIKILLGGEADQQFSEKLSDRVQLSVRKNIAKAQSGELKVIRGKAPGWLKVRADRSGFDLIPERRDVVKLVFQLGAEGRGSRWIAKHLNERGVKPWGTKQNASSGWDPTTIQWILKSPAIEGDYVSGYSNPSRVKNAGLVVPGYFPRAVDADLVARARTAMKSRKWSGGSRAPSAANLFRGLVKCGACGSRMYLNMNVSTGRVFQCSAAMSKRSCEQRETFRYASFEKSALDTILDLALDDRWFTKSDDTHASAIAFAEAQKRRGEHDARLQRAVDMMLDNEVGDVFAARIPELRRAVIDAKSAEAEAQDALERARGAVSPAEHQRRVMSVRSAIEVEDPDVRVDARLRVTQALSGIIDRIECHLDGEWGRSFWVTLKLDLFRIVIDQDGVVWEQVMMKPETGGDPANVKLLEDIVRRWRNEA